MHFEQIATSPDDELDQRIVSYISHRIVSTISDTVDAGISTILVCGAYGRKIFDAVGSTVLYEDCKNLRETEHITETEFNRMKDVLLQKSYDFVHLNYDIIWATVNEADRALTDVIDGSTNSMNAYAAPEITRETRDKIMNARTGENDIYNILTRVIRRHVPDDITAESYDDALSDYHKFILKKWDKKNVGDKSAKPRQATIDDMFNEMSKSALDKFASTNTTLAIKPISRAADTTTPTFELDTKQIDDTGCILLKVGILTKNKDMVTTGATLMGASSIMEGVTDMMVSGAILSPTKMILGGIMTVMSAFSKEKTDDSMQKFMMQLAEMLFTIRKEMHERFDEMKKILNANQQTLLDNFCNVNLKLDNLYALTTFISEQITDISAQIKDTHTNVMDKINIVLETVKSQHILSRKIDIMSNLRKLALEPKDKFDTNIVSLLSSINTIDDILSGDKVNVDLNLPWEFNINTLIGIANAACVNTSACHLYQTDQIAKYLETQKFGKVVVLIYSNDIWKIMENMIMNTTDDILFVIDNFEYHSFLKCTIAKTVSTTVRTVTTSTTTTTITATETTTTKSDDLCETSVVDTDVVGVNKICTYYGHMRDYIKNVLIQGNQFTVHLVESEPDAILTNLIGSTQYINDIKTINKCGQFNISTMQNPIFFTLYITLIIDSIEKQRNDDGTFNQGFVPETVFEEIAKLIPRIGDYYRFAKFCQNKGLYAHLETRMRKARDTLVQTVKTFYDVAYTRIAGDSQFNIMKAQERVLGQMELFKRQEILVRSDYNPSWFSATNNHYAGKFRGADSWCASFADARDGNQHAYHTAYRTHMETLLTKMKDDAISVARDILSATPPTFATTYNSRTMVVPKILPHLIHPHPSTPDLPILTAKPNMYNCCHESTYLWQFLYPATHTIEFKYTIKDNKEFIIDVYSNKVSVATHMIPYDPKFYTGKEAVMYFWYGGNMSVTGECCASSIQNSYTDNRSTTTFYYPSYTQRQACSWTDTIWTRTIRGDCVQTVLAFMQMERDKIHPTLKNDTYYNVSAALNDVKKEYAITKLFAAIGNVELDMVGITAIDNIFTMTGSDTAVRTLCDKSSMSTIKSCDGTCDHVWLSFEHTKSRYINLVYEIKGYSSTRITPSKKMEYNREVIQLLMNVIEQSGIYKNTGINIGEILKDTYASYETKLNAGTEVSFKDHLRTSLLALPNVPSNVANIMMVCP